MAGFRGGFGGGAQMQQLMRQAQKMQEEMQKAQKELEEAELIGESAGGLVKVTVNGNKVLQGVNIDSGAVDTDDIEMLEDLIMVAYNNAKEKAEKLYEEKMGPFARMGGGMF